jgi:hypothetical protein
MEPDYLEAGFNSLKIRRAARAFASIQSEQGYGAHMEIAFSVN